MWKFLLLVLLPAVVPTLLGGYSNVALSDVPEQVRQSAVKALIDSKPGLQETDLTLEKAMSQVVAGMNYRLTFDLPSGQACSATVNYRGYLHNDAEKVKVTNFSCPL